MDTNTLKERINSTPALMVYYFSPGCSSCNSLRPKVERMASTVFPEMDLLSIDASTSTELASSAGVYAAPTILVYFEGKEYLRESRYISIEQLEEKISRYYRMLFN
jgi:thioredoxin-like negative regulator of GroEL